MPFPVLSKEAIEKSLAEAGIEEGDCVYAASFAAVLGDTPGVHRAAIEALLCRVGPQGTVVMPAFNWDYCHGTVFDPATTPSQVGVLTEAFRRYPGTSRSLSPPWCTFAARGRLAGEIAEIRATSSFGPESVLQYLLEADAKYALIGCALEQGAVHVHWLEEKHEVPYRYWKRFIGAVVVDGRKTRDVSYMYARRLDVGAEIAPTPLYSIFDASPRVRKARLGVGELRVFRARHYVDFMEPYFARDKLAVLKPECRRHFDGRHRG